MQPFTLNKAATACNKSKATILNAIRLGRLSASRNDKNQWQIDPAELFRCYPPDQSSYQSVEPITSTQTGQENELLVRLELMGKLLLQVENERDDLKADRDHWRRQATMLLTHQPELHPEPPKAEQPTRSRLYEKLFGGK